MPNSKKQAAKREAIDRLRALRLDRFWTYKELGRQISLVATNSRVAHSTLQNLINHPHQEPTDLTFHAIELFLKHHEGKAAAPREVAREPEPILEREAS